MSLSSLLLSSGGKIDHELDVLFKSNSIASDKNTTALPSISPSSNHVAKKRKLAPEAEFTIDSEPDRSKRVKSSSTKSSKKGSTTTPQTKPHNGEKRLRSKGKTREAKEVEAEEDKSDLENEYLGAQLVHKPNALHDPEGDEEVSDEEPQHPVHESLRKDRKHNRAGAKTKFVPADETAERRDQRTIFIGNLPVEVAQKRPLLKQLQRHILAQVPSAKIESTRFRSIPFQTPTSKLPTSDDEEASPKARTQLSKQVKTHDRERASIWRERKSEKEKDDDTGKNDEKKYLNPNQKKKIAFINQEFHSSADTVHSYIVFAHPVPSQNRPSNLPPPPPTMDPYEAARLAAQRCEGTMFMDRMIRVDLVNKKVLSGEEKSLVESSIPDTDPKLSVFVGNLDFASKEEDVRVFFEGLVSAERGPPGANNEDDDDEGGETQQRPMTWVSRVRIVRDKDTQLGKGFAYVQFADRGCVDEVLAFDQSKLKFAKRKLRVQRCKTLPGSTRHATADSKLAKASRDTNTKFQGSRAALVSVVVPKGDQLLGEKLAHLPKEERKLYKSADADRVARRLAKKKARNALVNMGVKPLGKERERVRKGKSVGVDKGKGKRKGKGIVSKKEKSQGRVKSEESLLKRNTKKVGS